MTSLKTSIKTITYLSDIGCLEIQGASLVMFCKEHVMYQGMWMFLWVICMYQTFPMQEVDLHGLILICLSPDARI
ncbi:response regulator [Escherichia coli]|nr:response regulator [Escherichia coli]